MDLTYVDGLKAAREFIAKGHTVEELDRLIAAVDTSREQATAVPVMETR